MSPETLVAYLLASFLLAIAPGPDNLFVLTQSALSGGRSGILVVLGLCTGLIVHTAAVTFGVAAIFQYSTLAFTLLKLAGAGYLLYLAWGAFRAGAVTVSAEHAALTSAQLYRRGIVMNVTNPKVSIFFLAFLPQFVDPSRGAVSWQMSCLGLIFILVSFLVFSAIALMAGQLGGWLSRSERAQKWMNRIAGIVFAGLAVKLLLTQR
ncbi:MAG: LysE family translocator [Burkholderiaceae bacterium]|jgi:threonine/homoserine/homoserine lactone efflux protein|nr:LysE family translocator [Burkholderiaceae bacterium]